MRKFLLLILIFVTALFVLSFGSVSAQQVDVEDMSEEELMLLLQAIMDILEDRDSESETSEPDEPVPTGTPLAVNDSDSLLQAKSFEIFKNKKLIIENLPSYMFVQPTVESEETDSGTPGKKKKDGDGDPEPCRVGEQCVPDDWYCRYELTPDGRCVCMCG